MSIFGVALAHIAIDYHPLTALEQWKVSRASRLPMLQLTTATHSSRCLEAFHCSSAVSGWWSIAT